MALPASFVPDNSPTPNAQASAAHSSLPASFVPDATQPTQQAQQVQQNQGSVSPYSDNTGIAPFDVAKNIVSGAFNGIKQIGTGLGQVGEGLIKGTIQGQPGGADIASRGGLNVTSGFFNTLAAPVTGILQTGMNDINDLTKSVTGKTVGDHLTDIEQPVVDALSNNPVIQKFATENPNAGEVIQNIISTVGGLMAIHKAPAVQEAIQNAPEDIEGTIQKIKDTASKPFSNTPEDQMASNIKNLQTIEGNSRPLAKISDASAAKGIDLKSLVGGSGLLDGAVDENGLVNTKAPGGALDQFHNFMNQYEITVSDNLAKENVSIPLSDVEQKLMDNLNASKITGSAKTNALNAIKSEMNGLTLDTDTGDNSGNISLSKLQDAKISANSDIDWNNQSSQTRQELISNTHKTLIEDNTKTIDVKGVNAELSKFYQIEDYLKALDGKKVAGGRLGKYFAQTIGAAAGSHFGPFGTIIGAEIAGKLKGYNLSGIFNGGAVNPIEASDMLKNASVK